MDIELLIERSQAGDSAAKQRLVEENAGLIWSVARRYFGRGVEKEDLYQLGCLGFLKAVEGFDPAFGTRFSTYAVPKIAGEILRFLRDDGTVKVSRTLKERALQIRRARQALTGQLGREPSVTELAAELDLTPEELAEAESATGVAESIQQPAGQEGFTLENVLTDTRLEDEMVEHLALRQAVSRLPDRLRQLIGLRYYHGLTQQKTAEILGVSQVQVSRLEKRALAELRKFL